MQPANQHGLQVLKILNQRAAGSYLLAGPARKGNRRIAYRMINFKNILSKGQSTIAYRTTTHFYIYRAAIHRHHRLVISPRCLGGAARSLLSLSSDTGG
jgi:hypothetical protein